MGCAGRNEGGIGGQRSRRSRRGRRLAGRGGEWARLTSVATKGRGGAPSWTRRRRNTPRGGQSVRPRRITGRGPASLLPPTARYAALGMSSPSSTEGTDSAGHPPGNSLVGAHTSAASYCPHTRSHRSMSIAAAASMPWLNVCSVYRSRGISTRQARGVASTEARAILARHLPGLFNILPSLGTRPGRQISMKILKKDRTPRSLRTSASDTFPPRKNILRAADGRPQVNLPPGRSRCLSALGSFPRLTRRGASTASRTSRIRIRDPSPR